MKSYLKHTPLLFILISALVFRTIGINRGLWTDEYISINTLKNNIFINPFYYGYTTNLPLYFYILKVWSLGGIFTNTIYLRLLGILLSLANIAVVYNFFKSKKLIVSGVVTIILIATTPLQIHYAQEIRPYILTQLLITCHFFMTLDLIKSKDQIYSKQLTLVTVLLLITHYAAYLYLFIIFLVLVFCKGKEFINTHNLKKVLLIGLFKIGVIGLVVFNPQFLSSLQNSGAKLAPFNTATLTEMAVRIKEVISFYYYFGFWYYLTDINIQNIFKKFFLSLFLASIILVVLNFVKNKRKEAYQFSAFIVLITMLPLGFILEKVGFYPFGGRHIMPFSIFLYILIGFVVEQIWKKKVLKVLIIIFGVTTILSFLFHQQCVIKIAKKQPNIQQSQSYNYCIK